MQRISVAVGVSILLLLGTTRAHAQLGLGDLVTPILSHLDGFSGWVSNPSYIGKDSITSASGAGAPRYGFSLKYHLLHKWVREKVYTEVLDSACNSHMSCALSYYAGATLNFGYSYSSPIQISSTSLGPKDTVSYRSTFPYSGPFVSAVLSFTPSDYVGLAVGAQANFYGLTDAPGVASSTDTNGRVPFKASTGLIVSPELFVGLSFFRGLIFVDYVRQYTSFSGIVYNPTIDGSAGKLNNLVPRLPALVNLDNWQVKIGFSISTALK